MPRLGNLRSLQSSLHVPASFNFFSCVVDNLGVDLSHFIVPRQNELLLFLIRRQPGIFLSANRVNVPTPHHLPCKPRGRHHGDGRH